MDDRRDDGRARSASRARHRLAALVGSVLVLTATLSGGWLAWQMVGGNVVAQQAQQREVAATVTGWEHARTAARTVLEHAPLPSPATGEEPALIRIARFGRSYAVPIHPGVTDEVLARGFGHFKVSAAPGGWGNYALAAHRVTHGEPLRHVLALRPGDKAVVTTRHWTFVYRLDTDPRRLTVGRDGVWVVDYHPVNPDPHGTNPSSHFRLLTLVTCAEIFHTDDRTVVFGHLVSATPRS